MGSEIPLPIVKMLKEHEGVRAHPYMDTVGKITIGVGRNLTDKPLSQAAITFLFQEDYEEALDGLYVHLPFYPKLDPVRQQVLLDMAFNLGIGGLLKFKHTLKSIEEGRWHDAAIQMLASKWASQVGGRAETLAKMMATGVLPEKWR